MGLNRKPTRFRVYDSGRISCSPRTFEKQRKGIPCSIRDHAQKGRVECHEQRKLYNE
jgi:hypothetical protein